MGLVFVEQRQVLSALSQIAKHSVDLAEMVVEAEIFPVVLTCLKDKDEYVKKNASTLIREIAKHTPEVKQGEKKSASKYTHMLLVLVIKQNINLLTGPRVVSRVVRVSHP